GGLRPGYPPAANRDGADTRKHKCNVVRRMGPFPAAANPERAAAPDQARGCDGSFGEEGARPQEERVTPCSRSSEKARGPRSYTFTGFASRRHTGRPASLALPSVA